ncbi:MAG: M1 family metallopeptidase [Gemmatimonadota bacterium]|nr:MAG: M1 family metallopeptidase [Gemmatimonadota bacterium]
MRRAIRAVAVTLCVLAVHVQGAAAQDPTDDARTIPYPVTVSPEFQRALARGTRSPTGEPGPNYWQQWSQYTIVARLDAEARRIDGSVRIVYHNRSPDILPDVYLQLLQNLHAPGVVRNRPQRDVTGGVELKRVVAGGAELQPVLGGAFQGPGRSPRGYGVNGTTLQLRPPQPLRPGDSLVVEIDWGFSVPQSSSGRMGWSRDNLFHIAYWYPQMAVYDDVVGWHTDPYRGNSEFYMGYGDYDLTVEAPEGWVLTATGRLENADEVLPEAVYRRLQQAERSDSVVHVLTALDFGPGRATRRSDSGYLTWHFTAENVRDVTFSATRASLWDAARTPVGDLDGDGEIDYARAEAFYRGTAPRWQHAWRYVQHSIDFLSRWTGVNYPWPHMTAVEGAEIIGGGMEFPMLTLIGDYNQRGDTALYSVIAHELAHMWVPMIVGNDERRRAWMDEGTTSFNTAQAKVEFYPGLDWDAGSREEYARFALTDWEGEIMRWSDFQYTGMAYGVASYAKPATLLATLRGLLGEETFVRAYRTYLRNWSFKHPKPWDFFNTFSSVSGRNLDWFWRAFYFETCTLDQGVESVFSTNGQTTVVVRDYGLAPMPARLTVTLADGTVVFGEIGVEAWLSGKRQAELTLRTDAPPVRVEIDADNVFPDVRRENNVWVRP